MLLETAAALFAVGGGVIAPGFALCRSLGLGRGANLAVELTLAVAAGRLMLSAAAALAIGVGVPGMLLVWPPLGVAAALVAALRDRREAGAVGPRTSLREGAALCFGIAAAALLVFANTGRGGLADATGRLVFFGRDASNDSLMYLAQTRMLVESGFPLAHAFFAGILLTNSYVPFLVRAGLQAAAELPWLDLSFRVIPLLDVTSLAVAAAALVRVLGGPALAIGLGSVLMVLGSEASFLLPPLARILGGLDVRLASWGFGGPSLVGFNSITPAVQTLVAGLVALAIPTSRPRAAAIVAGVFFGALFEIKLFLWLPAIGALAAVAVFAAPTALRSKLRLATACAVVVSIPGLLDKAVMALRIREQGALDTGVRACLGCFPRYLVDGVLGPNAAPWTIFAEFENRTLLDPFILGRTLLACAVLALVLLGARWIGVPELLRRALARGEEASDPERVALARIVLASAGIGLVLSMTLAWRPHHLNVGQFAMSATFLLWPFTALVLARWWQTRRGLFGVGLALALASTLWVLGPRGYAAPAWITVEPGEQRLLDELEGLSKPGEIVIEPSFGIRPEVPSPVPWWTGRRVVFSDVSIATQIVPRERDARLAQLAAVFTGEDPAAARAALDASQASWVYVPAPLALRFPTQGILELAVESPAGRIYRVVAREAR